jgi:hypothetical protein
MKKDTSKKPLEQQLRASLTERYGASPFLDSVKLDGLKIPEEQPKETIMQTQTQPANGKTPAGKVIAIRRGRITKPRRLIVYGPEGVGKSTFAMGAPSPLWLGAESGTESLDIARLPEPKKWEDVKASIASMPTNEFKTLVVDPLNWFEPMVFSAVCDKWGARNIEKVDGGYGKGYTYALDYWRELIGDLDGLRDRGVNVILLAHSIIKNQKNPEGNDFDRFQIAMNEKAASIFRQWADDVLFARHEYFVKGGNDKDSKGGKGFSTGVRIMHTEWSAAWDAKNRAGLPSTLPLEWDAYWAAVSAPSNVRTQIESAARELGDEAISKWVAGALEKEPPHARMVEILNKLNAKMMEKTNG